MLTCPLLCWTVWSRQFLARLWMCLSLCNDRDMVRQCRCRAGAAVAVHRRSMASLRAAEANPHGPACSDCHFETPQLQSVRWSMPCFAGRAMPVVVRQVLMVQTLQKTVEVPQVYLLGGCGRRCDFVATSSGQSREVPQTCSSTRCSSPEEERPCCILRHLSHFVRMDVSARFSALDDEEFFVVEGPRGDKKDKKSNPVHASAAMDKHVVENHRPHHHHHRPEVDFHCGNLVSTSSLYLAVIRVHASATIGLWNNFIYSTWRFARFGVDSRPARRGSHKEIWTTSLRASCLTFEGDLAAFCCIFRAPPVVLELSAR